MKLSSQKINFCEFFFNELLHLFSSQASYFQSFKRTTFFIFILHNFLSLVEKLVDCEGNSED